LVGGLAGLAAEEQAVIVHRGHARELGAVDGLELAELLRVQRFLLGLVGERGAVELPFRLGASAGVEA
jgi:hypothetical protein